MNIKENKIFRTSIIILAISIMLGFYFIPAPTGLNQDSMAVIGVFIGTLILWLTISIDWPSLLCIFALSLVGTLGYKAVFASAFGNDTFVFLMFTFVCTYALSKTPLLKRIAVWFISTKLAKKNGFVFSILFLFSVLLIGCFVSPSVLFIVILPILNEIYQIAKIEKGEKAGAFLMLGLAFTVSISSGMTPIAHVFSTIAMSAYTTVTGLTISYLSYMLFAVPVGLIVFALMILLFKVIMKPDFSKLNNLDTTSIKSELPKISKNEIISLSIFVFVILLWILPSLLKTILPAFSTYVGSLGMAVPAILGTLLLCIITDNKKPLINVSDAFKNGIPWSSLIMCAGTLALGSALTNSSIGIMTFLTSNLSSALAGISPIWLLVIFVSWAALQTNVSSNMVTATVVSSVSLPILLALGTSINPAVVICLIGMMSAYAFATPPAMPHIAIASASGYTNTTQTLKYGLIVMVVSIIISVLIGYPLGTLVM